MLVRVLLVCSQREADEYGSVQSSGSSAHSADRDVNREANGDVDAVEDDRASGLSLATLSTEA